eukprot:jgi/Hompol1/1714/HPOL_000253-RA
MHSSKSQQDQLVRDSAPFNKLPSTRFIVTEKNYMQQYAGLYFTRLVKLRPRVLDAARAKWSVGDNPLTHVPRIINVQPGEVCFIIGTIYVDMPNKPNILKDIDAEEWSIMPEVKEKYTSANDKVLMEDESGRINITGDVIKRHPILTGIVLAILGSENEQGEFQAIDLCYASFEPQRPLPLPPTVETGSKWIALLSGLDIGRNPDSFDIRYQLLTDFLTGEVGYEKQQEQAGGICRLIICGNTIACSRPSEETRRRSKSRHQVEDSGFDNAIEVADVLLQSLCASLPVDVMPGQTDPATSFLPQQPMHPSIFVRASQLSSLGMLTNPCSFDVGPVAFCGHSGQPLDDMRRMTEVADDAELAAEALKWAHIAPTAPDTLWCHPMSQDDPLVLDTRPHVFFVGNQHRFDTTVVQMPSSEGGGRKLETTRVVLVPSFSETGILVLINLATIECKIVEFGPFAS